MFDLSWAELIFVAVLALIIVGPKDMPKLFKVFGHATGRLRRLYRDFQGGVHQLEKEIDIAGKNVKDPEPWKALMPEHIRNLPDDFTPGSMTAEQHQSRQKKREAFIKTQEEKATNSDSAQKL